ncbi:MAG: chemotaxis protein CheB [Henriciella sp.]|uniref:chemotaxis protein CheB n=1 Tax=Henriciella sp. TaxID=1968823 RepID=UPI003C769E8C
MAATPKFPVVGVGASAGGLEAYRAFLSRVPSETGAAYVFIQHLDPNHESRMAELLAKYSKMKIVQVEAGMTIERNCVYVIPPNKFVKLDGMRLELDDPIEERGIRLAIDYFFRSLSEQLENNAVGIVLSGTGTDGALGIREIKANGGMVMAQKPDTAQYDGMPRAAVATGVVDFVLPIDEMPDVLEAYVQHPYVSQAPEPMGTPAPADLGDLKNILTILRAHSGHNFRHYKQGTLRRRVQRRMGLKHLNSVEAYLDVLRKSPAEVKNLHKDLLIGVTRFFRDPEAWQVLDELVLSKLVEQAPPGSSIRAWVPGCASGEEAYTLAMMLSERIKAFNKPLGIQIFATDLSEDSIAYARAARYPSTVSADVPERFLESYFSDDGEMVTVNKRLRDSVVFAHQNIISDPPFSKLDLVSCRNLMIYLNAEIQRRMIEMFHFALRDTGYLFLGPSETAERPGRLFKPLSKPNRIYQRGYKATPHDNVFPVDRRRTSADPKPVPFVEAPVSKKSVAQLSRQTLLKGFSPPSVCINRRFEILYYHGAVRDYLDFPAGEPSHIITDLAVPELKSRLRALLTKVLETGERDSIVCNGVPRNKEEVDVKLTATLLEDDGEDELLLLVFEDISDLRERKTLEERREEARAMPGDTGLVEQLEYELQTTREDRQSTIEEMETANEELNASNEEVMSMNEELQSANEELETSREELQSLNEELTTLNTQLENQVDEVESANNDLSNLLNSTNIAVIFLDTDLCIRRYTPAMQDVMRIIESDIGRPVEDLSARVSDPNLIEDSRTVLKTLQPVEAEVEAQSGHHFIRKLQPYRTSDNRIEGVVATFTDVTKLQAATDAVARRERQQAAITEIGRKALAGHPSQELFDLVTKETTTQLGVKFAKILRLTDDGKALDLVSGLGWKKGLVGTYRVDATGNSQASFTLERANAVIVEDFRTERRFTIPQLLADHDVSCGASVIIGPVASPWGVLGAHDQADGDCSFTVDDVNFMQSVSNFLWLAIVQENATKQLDDERRELRQLADSLPILIAIVGSDERYVFVNDAYREWAVDETEVTQQTVKDLLGDKAYKTAKPHIDKAMSGETTTFELALEMPEGQTRTNLVTYVPRYSLGGTVEGFYAAIVDISDRKRDEERQKVISAELDHRVKNILATAASIARISGRNAVSLDDFRTSFQQRIEALGRAHQTLASERWEGLSLRRLLEEELSPYNDSNPDRITFKGTDVTLAPAAAQSLALVLHELITNASKYGALSQASGKLSIQWTLEQSSNNLKFSWKESGLKGVEEPSRKGFGSTMIGHVIRDQLKADVDMDFKPSGFQYSLRLPAKYLRRNK